MQALPPDTSKIIVIVTPQLTIHLVLVEPIQVVLASVVYATAKDIPSTIADKVVGIHAVNIVLHATVQDKCIIKTD